MIYKKLGKDHYEIYKSFFIDKPNHIEFSDELSSRILLPLNKEDVYVYILNESGMIKPNDIAHEAGHFFAYNIRQSKHFLNNSYLLEVESIFYELLFIDYLIEENIHPNEALNLLKESIESQTIYDASLLNIVYSPEISKVKNVKDFKKILNKNNFYKNNYYHTTKDLLSQIDTCNVQNSFMYIYSTLIALELYDEYTLSYNKKDVIKKYENFLKKVGIMADAKLSRLIIDDNVTFNNFKTLKKHRIKYL